MKKTTKIVVALLLPIVIFIWIIGWSLYWTGQAKTKPELKQKEPKHERPAVQN